MIAIKNMAMPKSCSECSFKASDYVCGLLDCAFSCNHFKERNYNCPLVEVEEQKVGKWIRKPIRNEKGGCIGAEMICSYCKKDNEQDKKLAYCPNCGCFMKKD